MAYITPERKLEIAPKVKQILNKYGVRGTLSVRNRSHLVLKISSGRLDLIGDCVRTCAANYPTVTQTFTHINVNKYHLHSQHSGECLQMLTEVLAEMNQGNWDRSDSQSDYFDVGWYVDVQIGAWNKPYVWQQ